MSWKHSRWNCEHGDGETGRPSCLAETRPTQSLSQREVIDRMASFIEAVNNDVILHSQSSQQVYSAGAMEE